MLIHSFIKQSLNALYSALEYKKVQKTQICLLLCCLHSIVKKHMINRIKMTNLYSKLEGDQGCEKYDTDKKEQQ